MGSKRGNTNNYYYVLFLQKFLLKWSALLDLVHGSGCRLAVSSASNRKWFNKWWGVITIVILIIIMIINCIHLLEFGSYCAELCLLTVKPLASDICHISLKYTEACLRCLRTIFTSRHAPADLIYQVGQYLLVVHCWLWLVYLRMYII